MESDTKCTKCGRFLHFTTPPSSHYDKCLCLIPQQHVLYEPKDFTNEEMDRRNVLAVAVCEGGLGVCKNCGASEIELDKHKDCASYRRHRYLKRRTP